VEEREMNRFLAAIATFLLCCGMIAVLVGFLWDRYSWQTGIIVGAVFWAIGLSLAVFIARGGDHY
jgi:fucose permease